MSTNLNSSVDQSKEEWKDQHPLRDEQFYIVQSDPDSSADRCLLEDGRAVLCAVEDRADARIIALGHDGLEVVAHSELSPQERERVADALQ
mgnify:CR=1 FL=1